MIKLENNRRQTYLKEDITKIDTSKEDSNKQLLEQRDETSELSVKLSMDIDSCNKTKRWSNENQDKPTRLHESGTISKVIKDEKESMISCWKEDIIRLETSKESSRKQFLLQRHETTALSIKL